MKKIVYIFCICLSFYTCAQNKKANIIILVDGEVVKYSYIKINMENGKNITCNFQPGNLELKESDYEILKDNKIKSFQFTFSKICKEQSKSKMYEIGDFKLSWLDQPYVILYVYNTDDKKYKKIYNPLANKSYTYEYDTPGGSMRRVQKKLTQEQKRCSSN
ncbi:hypothetical protein MQX03_11630 [Chryseobacterium aahli]|uniref:hypothetical protein n=1 Tax=Chryseobacterium aahli TaxID=1278643 RepID=UPI001F61D36D|nr:hypothetical protein [Chryseobacterium aahli]MCI3937853.1 hypothetical protein [Chryseobacterium aahli]